MLCEGGEEGKNTPLRVVPKPKLLVVDEDITDTCEYCSLLREHGFDVHCICSYAEGAACVLKEPIDLVIVGQGSPAFEGRCVVERAIEKDRHTPVLVLTRSVEMNCHLEAMQLGAFDYVEKPVDASQMLKMVATHIRSRN